MLSVTAFLDGRWTPSPPLVAPHGKSVMNYVFGGGLTMQTISNDPPPTGTRCDICGRQLSPPWVKSGPYRMHLSCRDAINDDLERKVVDQNNPKSANDDTRDE
jgi:hypothetical protein